MKVSASIITPRQAIELIPTIIAAGEVPYLESSPGVGKSSITNQLANKLNLEPIDVRFAALLPEDFSGLPFKVNDRAIFLPFQKLFPTADMEVPEGKDGWLLFLDEMPLGSQLVLKASFKLLADRCVGMHKLHPKVYMVGAGNGVAHRSMASSLGAALRNRLTTLYLEANGNEWIEDYALAAKLDPRVTAYIAAYPQRIDNFADTDGESPFCSPRSWEKVSKMIQGAKDLKPLLPAIAGVLGEGEAVTFTSFTKYFKKIPTMKEVEAGTAKVPDEMNYAWATMMSILEQVDKPTLQPVINYVEKWELTYQMFFIKMLKKHNMKLFLEPAMVKFLTRPEITKLL